MSSLQQRSGSATEQRLAAIIATSASLKAQIGELEKLRDQVRQAQSASRS
jgi:hypothetical protein